MSATTGRALLRRARALFADIGAVWPNADARLPRARERGGADGEAGGGARRVPGVRGEDVGKVAAAHRIVFVDRKDVGVRRHCARCGAAFGSRTIEAEQEKEKEKKKKEEQTGVRSATFRQMVSRCARWQQFAQHFCAKAGGQRRVSGRCGVGRAASGARAAR